MHKDLMKPQQDFDRGQYFRVEAKCEAFKTICKTHKSFVQKNLPPTPWR